MPVSKKQQKWYQRLKDEPGEACFYLGFLIRQEWMIPSLGYLMQVSQLFIRRISVQPDIELMREEAIVLISKEEKYPFAFMAINSVKKEKNKRAIHTSLENALKEFKTDQRKLL